MGTTADVARREPWNKGKIVGQNAPFKILGIEGDDALELAEQTEI